MIKAVDDDAFEAFLSAMETTSAGVRIKDVRAGQLVVGGRAKVSMFEAVGSGGRAHPRLRIAFDAAVDPAPPSLSFEHPSAPSSAAEFETWIRTSMRDAEATLAASDLDDLAAPAGSEKFWRNSIRAQRRASFFASVFDTLAGWRLEGTLHEECSSVARVLEDEAFAGMLAFDDADTGTYHSYGKDKPFVHYLEALLGALPDEGSEAMALLRPERQTAVRRQRRQLRAHLDHLMRHKYAYEVVNERDIERTVGGLLIDRVSRHIVSEVSESDVLSPSFGVLRVDPGSSSEHAGEWVYRDAEGKLHLQDGRTIEVESSEIRTAPIDAAALTFLRAPSDERLRANMRLDWDGNGFVRNGPIEWVSWAGHCDVKAVLEQVGITLTEQPAPSVREFRSDTAEVLHLDRDLLLEMVTSVVELGSSYRRLDGTGREVRGEHRFGGARNDSLPDRIQFAGERTGSGFRWPLSGRKESFVVRSIRWPDGVEADMGTVFYRLLPDMETLAFGPNPRYSRTVEGDYNIIDVSGARLEVDLQIDAVDPETGYLTQRQQSSTLDLSSSADERFFLGTHVDDPARRRVFDVYWEPATSTIVGSLFEYVRGDSGFEKRAVEGESVRLPMQNPPTVTLSREMRRDDPAQYEALLAIARRQAKNICADTDKHSAVWNGVVTKIDTQKVASNPSTRTEHWTVDIEARFGKARLAYLVRRAPDGEPEAYCPAVADDDPAPWPDFLWHDIPDVGSKGFVGGEWVVNESMLGRGIVTVEPDASVQAGQYVHDEHIKNTFELIYCAFAGYRYTVVHEDKRYGFFEEAAWARACEHLRGLRSRVRFEAASPLPPRSG